MDLFATRLTRVYYRITALGKQVAAAEAARLETQVATAQATRRIGKTRALFVITPEYGGTG